MTKSKLPLPNNDSDLTELGKDMGSAWLSMVKGALSGVPKWVFVAIIGTMTTSLGATIWLIVWGIQTLSGS